MAGLCVGGNEPRGSLKASNVRNFFQSIHACLFLTILIHCAPISLQKASDQLLLGRLLLLSHDRGTGPPAAVHPTHVSAPFPFESLPASLHPAYRFLFGFNCPKTGVNLTSDTKKAPLMRQLGQKIMR
ncbi:hypothetical protein ANN_18242 [Periplaneta americana]|uniref:Uncharacterized protein n=1 Tax=Periplaneta americana TaxID=6978 RepID=A0ABQ8SN71_PERAM|nr:hypothetical protein ANN_18242 [Periplaneta americana]